MLLATLPLIVQLIRFTEPVLSRPPPSAAMPPVMVNPERIALPSTWNTRLALLPLTVTPAAGPVIVTVAPVLFSRSWPAVKVIVWALAKIVASNVIVCDPDRTLARLIAPRRSSLLYGTPEASKGVLTFSGVD